MDRNREARRAAATNNHNHHMAAPPNGLSSSSSRRRHRSNSLRDSPDEDGGVELHEQQQQQQGRLRERERERGVVKKDRDRERERASRSKRRRENRMMMMTSHNSNRDTEIDDTSEESVNDEEEDEDDDDDGGNGLQRMLPPPSSNPVASGTVVSTNHHSLHSQQQLHHRKTFPPAANKVIRAAAPPPAWKAADEMIGVSVPRKARSASTKRSHEWVSGSGVVGGGASTEQNHRQSSASPVHLASATASPVPAAPPSPSSSSVSVRKKMKANGGGSKPRPPKSSSKSSSSNPEELEIEIAEVLYGLMTQSQAPTKKEITPSNDNKSTNDNSKSRVSSPISNSTVIPKNSTSLSTVAPKRKKPRQVSENTFGVRNNPVKTEVDQHNQQQHHHHQSPKTDSSGSAAVPPVAAENGGSFGFTSLPGQQPSSTPSSALPQAVAANESKCDVGVVLTKQEVEKEASAVGKSKFTDGVTTTTASVTTTTLKTANLEAESQKEEKFEIDLMAPPPQQRTSQESDGDIDFSDRKQIATQELNKIKEDEKLVKCGKLETLSLTEELKNSKAESLKQSMNEQLHIDLEKPNKDSANLVSCSSNKSLHQALKHQQLSAKPETHSEKTAQPSSMQIPMSVANWPPMGYVAPLQGVISMDGNPMPSAAPIQPIFTQPRPKRCATHCYIARNIHYLQQFMKINPFWPAASAPAPIFGGKPHNVNVMPSTELHGNIPQSLQDKSPGLNIFSGHAAAKENKSSQPTTVPDPAQRKQQVLLQQAMPPVTPNNILHGPAFIFPFNQQQAVAASASVRPGSSKLNSTSAAGGLVGPSGAVANTATVSTSTSAAAPALSFNYPNMSANETQYLAILQNNPYTFPIPAAVGAPPNYRGNPHAQAMPLFNGSFYSSQMIHPSQIPQTSQQAPPAQSLNHHPSQSQQVSQTHQNSSGSTSSSQKHLQAQQRQQQQQQGGSAAVNGSGSGNGASLHNNYPAAHKNRSNQPSQHLNPPLQARHLENEVTGGEDSPSTADSRASRAANTMSVYGHNFAVPVHSHNFALMNPQTAMSNTAVSGNSNDKKQQHQQSQQQGLKRGGAESSLPQTFAMSFAPMNGSTGAMAQNHAAMFQNLPESLRQTYHHMMTAPASAASSHHSQQKKESRGTEDASRTAGHEFSNVDEDRKGSAGLTAKSGHSIAFSRPDLAKDASVSSPAVSSTSVIDSSLRTNINLGANNRSTPGSVISNSVAAPQSNHQLNTQLQQQHHQHQQQVLQLQKQQQQQHQQQQQQHHHHQLNARSKNPPSSNGGVYPDHLVTSSSSIANANKFPSSLSSFPLQTSNASSSPVQSPQWRNSVRGPATSQVPSSLATSTTSSLKNLHQSPHQTQQQQQSGRPHQQSHTQISFGAASQKLPSTTSSSTSHVQQQSQNQNQNQNPGSNSNNNQSPSPPMLVGSPTTSSMSKGGGGSPRMNAAGSASTSGRPGQISSLSSSSQQPKNSPVGTQRPSPSILGNPHNSNSAKSQQQQQQQHLQQQVPKQVFQQHQAQAQAQAQAHMFFTHPYMQVQQAQAQAQAQAQQHSGSPNTAAGYYAPRKQHSSQPQNHQTSTEMLSLCPPVTLANTTTSDPAKAIAAATSNLKGGGGVGLGSQQGILNAAPYGSGPQSSMPAGFPQYAPAAVQLKPVEQKQPAGNDNLRTWQPEKK